MLGRKIRLVEEYEGVSIVEMGNKGGGAGGAVVYPEGGVTEKVSFKVKT